MWALVVAGTWLLALLPWLPPPQAAAQAAPASSTSRCTLDAAAGGAQGETLLEAGLRRGLALPYECRNGGCGVCMCTVLHGTVDHGIYQRSGALPDALRAQGKALMCCATPLSDVDIDVETMGDARAAARARGARGAPGPFLRRRDPPDASRCPTARTCPSAPASTSTSCSTTASAAPSRSFANPPQVRGHIELHVRRIPGGRFTGQCSRR